MSKKTKNVSKDKSASKPVVRPPKKGERQLRVEFTEKEILEQAKKLAEANAELSRAENNKKSVTSQLKADCDSISSRIAVLSGKINDGFEYRQVNVETTFDDPKRGMKTTRRLDTCETVECETMTGAEMQEELPLTTSGSSGAAVISMTTGKPERPPLRTVTSSGVVATEEDGDGEELQNEDDSKT